jgi:homoserine O-acetyltransferase/O-succinyltransferase
MWRQHLRPIIEFSMGAQQAFQWAVSYPSFADRIVAAAGTAKCYPHGVVRLEGQIAALTTDPTFENGDYKEQPKKGLGAFAVVWTGWLFSQEWWRRELWREGAKPGTTFEQVLNGFRTNFIPGADANNLNSANAHLGETRRRDHGGFGGDLERALKSIKVPILYMPSETDLYFPVGDARYEAAFIPGVSLVLTRHCGDTPREGRAIRQMQSP